MVSPCTDEPAIHPDNATPHHYLRVFDLFLCRLTFTGHQKSNIMHRESEQKRDKSDRSENPYSNARVKSDIHFVVSKKVATKSNFYNLYLHQILSCEL